MCGSLYDRKYITMSGIESDTLLNLNGSNNNASNSNKIQFPTERIDYYFSWAI